jgi:uncharacterized protein with HEPN domain
MPVEEDLAAIVDVVAAARQILHFVEGFDFDRFRGDPKTSSAVIFQLLIIGEASKRLPPAFHADHPELPWSEIVRMRDRLIHHYRRTDLRQVWLTIEKDLPELLSVLSPLAEPSP